MAWGYKSPHRKLILHSKKVPRKIWLSRLWDGLHQVAQFQSKHADWSHSCKALCLRTFHHLLSFKVFKHFLSFTFWLDDDVSQTSKRRLQIFNMLLRNASLQNATEDKITDLKKQHESPENCLTLFETKVNQGVWKSLDESARLTDRKFQKGQKSLIKGVIGTSSEVKKSNGKLWF